MSNSEKIIFSEEEYEKVLDLQNIVGYYACLEDMIRYFERIKYKSHPFSPGCELLYGKNKNIEKQINLFQIKLGEFLEHHFKK